MQFEDDKRVIPGLDAEDEEIHSCSNGLQPNLDHHRRVVRVIVVVQVLASFRGKRGPDADQVAGGVYDDLVVVTHCDGHEVDGEEPADDEVRGDEQNEPELVFQAN
jgi:hypothetical protein